ncbi:MAG: carbohydrate ABC transporter permease [Spirochaetae bacterium HGW-Spirochaetae-8]|jgi:multiple sugar transport system permease protein|nr:MAG: carbohydrate ABC transporter permease [Spirochaetae bacterium HGW-Spirochaetae-8]
MKSGIYGTKFLNYTKSLLFTLLIIVIVFWSSGPIFVAIASSFKSNKDIFTYKPVIIFKPVLENYIKLVSDWPVFFKALRNSIVATGLSILTVLLLALPAAYSFSRRYCRGFKSVSLFLIIVRMFPPIVITIPLYPIFRSLGLIDTPWALILVFTAFQLSISVMLLKAFIDSVPIELEEQASIDGCTGISTFFKIILPLLWPGIIAIIIFVAIFSWNDFTFSFLLTGVKAKTAPVVIGEMQGLLGTGSTMTWGMMFAASTIQFLPMLIFIWLTQKKLIGGYMLGSVKG